MFNTRGYVKNTCLKQIILNTAVLCDPHEHDILRQNRF